MAADRQLLVLHHTPGAASAGFQDALDSRSFVADRHLDVPAGDALPTQLDDVAGLLVLGGTMSAIDPDAYPWMAPELELLRATVNAEVPVLCVGLGAQLLGAALGGRVERREVPRAAYVPLRRTDEGCHDPVPGGWPDGAVGLFLHEDDVTMLPPGAVPVLADDDSTAAWRVGSALALQFHPEVTGPQLQGWAAGGTLDDLLARAGVDGTTLADEGSRRSRVTVAHGRALVGRFLDDQVRERTAP